MNDALAVSGALVLVIGAILLVYWACRYLQQKGAGSGRMLRVIDRVMLGKEKYLVLIDFQGDLYLLGVSEQSVSLLEKIEGALSADSAPAGFKMRLDSLKGAREFMETKGSRDEKARKE